MQNKLNGLLLFKMKNFEWSELVWFEESHSDWTEVGPFDKKPHNMVDSEQFGFGPGNKAG